MPLYDLLSNTARTHPDKLASICGDNRYNYTQFKNRVDRLAKGLGDIGINKTDKIAMIHRNCHIFLEAYFASAKLGAVLVPINYRLAPDDFVYILNHSLARLLIAQSDLIKWIYQRGKEVPLLENIILTSAKGIERRGGGGQYVEGDTPGVGPLEYERLLDSAALEKERPRKVSVQDIAQIYYTSGTTGRPKGVILTHENNLVHAEGTIKELALTDKDRWLHVSPMFHLADAWAVWSITRVGGTHVIIPGFEQELVLEAIEKHKVTLSNFIPTMLNILVNFPGVMDHNFDSLRLIMSGGAPIAKEVVRKVMDVFGCDYIQTYGLTETSPFLTMSILKDRMKDLPFEERLRYMVTTGRPFYNVKLKVVKEGEVEDEGGTKEERVVKEKEGVREKVRVKEKGGVGEGGVGGRGVKERGVGEKEGGSAGIYDVIPDEEDVGEIIVKGDTITPGYWRSPEESSKRIVDGWLYTGDLAVINPEGYVTIVDRIEDMIITGGENVYSTEVEDVLYSHSSIFEAAVIGLPDPIWGEKVTAVVVVKEGKELSEAELIGFCKDKMARFKAPKRVIFVKELPKTGSSKIYKYRLREMFGGR